jgi:hypothetical protein
MNILIELSLALTLPTYGTFKVFFIGNFLETRNEQFHFKKNSVHDDIYRSIAVFVAEANLPIKSFRE